MLPSSRSSRNRLGTISIKIVSPTTPASRVDLKIRQSTPTVKRIRKVIAASGWLKKSAKNHPEFRRRLDIRVGIGVTENSGITDSLAGLGSGARKTGLTRGLEDHESFRICGMLAWISLACLWNEA